MIITALALLAVAVPAASASQQTFSKELGVGAFPSEGNAEYEGKYVELNVGSTASSTGYPATNIFVAKWKFDTSLTPVRWHPLSLTVGFATKIYSGHIASRGPFDVVIKARTGKVLLAQAEVERQIPLEPPGGPAVQHSWPYQTYSMTLNLPAKYRGTKTIIVEAYGTPWQPEEGTGGLTVYLVKPTISATLEGTL
jgi:hypothetical protein